MLAASNPRRSIRTNTILFCIVAILGDSPRSIAEVPGGLQLQLRQRIVAPHAAIRLSQIVDGLSADQITRYGQTIIALIPPEQQAIQLTQAAIRNTLKSALPAPATVSFQGADVIEIVRGDPQADTSIIDQTKVTEVVAIQRVSLDDATEGPKQPSVRIQRIIEQAIERALIDASVPFSGKPVWQSVSSDLDKITRVVRVQLRESAAVGIVAMELEADTPAGRRFFSIQALLRSIPTALATNKSLRPGEIITAKDIELRGLRDVTQHEWLSDPKIVVGQQVKRYLSSGSWLSQAVLGSPTLVRKNDLVEIRVQGGGVVVRTNGRSKDDGAAGDLISVESLANKKQLVARVVETGVVEVLTRPPGISDVASE